MHTFKRKVRSAMQALVDKFENEQRFREDVVLVLGTIAAIVVRVIRKR